MNFVKIIRSIEEIIFNIFLWLYVLPATVLRILVDGRWTVDYINGELDRDDGSRFEEYPSPMILYILCSVLPFYLFVRHNVFRFVKPGFSEELIKLKFEEQLLLCSVTFLIPFVFAAFNTLLTKKLHGFNRSSFEVNFYYQCYLLAPYAVLSNLLTLSTIGSEKYHYYILIFNLVLIIFLEVRLFRKIMTRRKIIIGLATIFVAIISVFIYAFSTPVLLGLFLGFEHIEENYLILAELLGLN